MSKTVSKLKKKHATERIELSEAQKNTAIALFVQRDQVMAEAQKALDRTLTALDDLAETYARRAHLAGRWEFAQDGPGQPLYLRRKVEKKAETPPEGEGQKSV